MCIAPAASCEKGARFATAPSAGTADGGGPVTWLSAARIAASVRGLLGAR